MESWPSVGDQIAQAGRKLVEGNPPLNLKARKLRHSGEEYLLVLVGGGKNSTKKSNEIECRNNGTQSAWTEQYCMRLTTFR